MMSESRGWSPTSITELRAPGAVLQADAGEPGISSEWWPGALLVVLVVAGWALCRRRRRDAVSGRAAKGAGWRKEPGTGQVREGRIP